MKCLVVLMFAVLAVVPAQASATVVFRDDFTGPAGAQPNQAIWRSLTCPFVQGVTCKDYRARLDGAGSLAIDVTPSEGGFIGTFNYGTGWPPSGVRAAWYVPFTLKARLKMPTKAGVWSGVWMMNVDRSLGQGIWELDVAEPRSSTPSKGSCFQHYFATGVHRQWGNHVEIGGIGQWHTYILTVTADRAVYTVDGMTCMLRTDSVPKGKFGLLIDSLAGKAGTWQTNYGPALSGSARTLVDYVEISR
jgi:beta-glucanase (GH16 family)